MRALLSWLQQHANSTADLHLDSRQVGPGDVFIACPGEVSDGRHFMAQAVAAGAAAVICEDNGLPEAALQALAQAGVPVKRVRGLAAQAPALAAQWYGQPSHQLAVVAITGTNGKTSTTQWLQQALQSLGVACGVVGTLGVRLPTGEVLDTGLTTPDGVTLQRILAAMQRAGARVVAVEASSIGIAQGRLDAVQVQVAALTNLTRDHLDFHGDMASYAAAKARLFRWPGLTTVVLNSDDAFGREQLAAADMVGERWCYGWREPETSPPVASAHEVRANDVQLGSQGVRGILGDAGGSTQVHAPVLGAHNVDNVLLVATVLRALGHGWSEVRQALGGLVAVPGRLEQVALPVALAESQSLPLVVVDYAHTADALAQVLQALRPLLARNGARLHCVFGCGGNRDPGKRPQMAQVAGQHADVVWVTSDNPRDEAPLAIIDDIQGGRPATARCWQVEPERARAILKAIAAAGPHDVVLLAGKGHEAWQEMAGRREPFRDADWARLALLWRGNPRVTTDTRKLAAGDLYVALRGEHFDGNAFAAQALSAGACAAVVADTSVAGPGLCLPLGNGRAVLQHLAACRRDGFDGPLIAVTGSNGKTTTKEMIAAILRAWQGDAAVLATRGNLNNDIGVPLTLLELHHDHRVAVVELGMNHPGEIADLAALAKPTVGLVNNAQREHQEFMRSVRAVAEENGSVLQALADDGVAVFPADDPHTDLWHTLAEGRRCLRFALQASAEVTARDIELGADGARFVLIAPPGEHVIRLPIAGVHNVRNALAAAACCLAAGCPLPAVARGLARFTPAPGRLVADLLPGDVMVIDDTYNANPDSVRAAIDVLAGMTGPRALVLGDMGEVGEAGPQMHAEVGAYARERGIEHLLALGEATGHSVAAFGPAGVHARTTEQVVSSLLAARPASVLFKGSRFMRMEMVLQAWRDRLAGVSGDSDVA